MKRRDVNRLDDDKRLVPEWGEYFWAHRKSERKWHRCKYCRKTTPSFIYTEGDYGDPEPRLVLRCCWECGSGLQLLEES